MNSLGIFAADKPRSRELVNQLVQLALARGIAVRLAAPWATVLGRAELASSDADVAACDVLATFSGDGGVLAAARAAAPHGTPIWAVNLGRLGFLSSVQPDELTAAFETLCAGGFAVEERMMLEARVRRNGADIGGSIGLNDAVVAKSALARILRLHISVDGELVEALRADGLVISTPTGSTAYALSTGGPIVHPAVPLLLLCPICAHTLTQRPLVIGPDETVEILAEWDSDEVPSGDLRAMLTVDGQVGVGLQSGDVIRVRRSAQTARLLQAPDDGFYSRLRQKLGWGD